MAICILGLEVTTSAILEKHLFCANCDRSAMSDHRTFGLPQSNDCFTQVSGRSDFLMVLLDRNRINLLNSVIAKYLELVYETASIKMIEVSTASAFTNSQKTTLIQKLKELTNAREIRLVINLDPSLIGGFLIKTDSKVIDFSVKNQLQNLAKHLDTVLEI